MADHDSIIIDNNSIYRGNYLIFSSGGASTRTNDYWTITNNLLGGAANISETYSSTAIYAYYSKYFNISYNNISDISVNEDQFCIYNYFCDNNQITNNTIKAVNTLGASAYTYYIYNFYCNQYNVNNNKISDIVSSFSTGGAIYGVFNQNCSNFSCNNNRIYNFNASYTIIYDI